MTTNATEATGVEMLGKAAEGDVDVVALKEEIAQLKSDKVEMEAAIKRLTNDRDQYSKWWSEACVEKEQLRTVVKALVTYAKLV